MSAVICSRAAQRRKEQALAAMRDQFIVCGFGRADHAIAGNLRETGRSVVTIEQDAERCARAKNPGVSSVCGNAASAEALLAAGIDGAAAIRVAMGSDADNVHIVLSARATAPQIRVIARAITSETVERHTVAGPRACFLRPPREETVCAGDVLVMIGPPPNVEQSAEQAGK